MTAKLNAEIQVSRESNIEQNDPQLKKTAIKLIISEILPCFVSRFTFTIHQYISMYFQYNFVLKENPLIFVVIYAGTSLTQAFTVGTWLLFSQIGTESLMNLNIEKAEYYNRIAFKISVFWTIVGLCIFYPIDSFIVKFYTMPSILWFQYYVSIAIAVPIQTFFEGQALRYGSENRLLLKSSTFCFYSVFFVALESILYFFVDAKSTWPTAVVFIFTGVMMILWTSVWNTGYTCFGIINRTVIKTDWKLVLSLRTFKSEMKDIVHMLTLSSSLTMLKMSFGVGVLLSVTESLEYGQNEMVLQGELLLVHAYFGQVFRIASLCASEFFIKHTFVLITKKMYKRLVELIVKAIIFGIMLNALTIVLLMFLPIIQQFIPLTQNITETILLSGIAGMCSIFTEIALSISLADQNTVIIFSIGVIKIAGIIVIQFLFNKFLSNQDSFFKISFWGEVGGGVAGLVVIICFIIDFTRKGKLETKNIKQKKKSKEK